MFNEGKHIRLLSYADDDSLSDYNYTVQTVWRLPLERVRVLNPTAVKILQACTLFQLNSMPYNFSNDSTLFSNSR